MAPMKWQNHVDIGNAMKIIINVKRVNVFPLIGYVIMFGIVLTVQTKRDFS
jgi:hypothetical protein